MHQDGIFAEHTVDRAHNLPPRDRFALFFELSLDLADVARLKLLDCDAPPDHRVRRFVIEGIKQVGGGEGRISNQGGVRTQVESDRLRVNIDLYELRLGRPERPAAGREIL